MKNKELNENKINVVVAAVISAMVFAIAGLVPALWISVKENKKPVTRPNISDSLLIDAAAGLRSSVSELRLCTEHETAERIAGKALVYAVRAETALECKGCDYDECREHEAFLNDITAILSEYDPMDAAELAEQMYGYALAFSKHVSSGEPFSYNGELVPQSQGESEQATEEQIAVAAARIQSVLSVKDVRYIGDFGGHIEFELERDGVTGYAMAFDDRIAEFSFERGGSGEEGDADAETAQKVALECAEECGYPDMHVYDSTVTGNYVLVKLCKSIDGAMASRECASVGVVDGRAVAFRAGDCDCKHTVPKVKVTEKQARAATENSMGEGVLVTYNDGKRDRVCYEYKVELDDGVHYVYICAENGKQTRVGNSD